jgi:hypothetical protein
MRLHKAACTEGCARPVPPAGAASEQPELSREEEALEMVRKHIAPIKQVLHPRPPPTARDSSHTCSRAVEPAPMRVHVR